MKIPSMGRKGKGKMKGENLEIPDYEEYIKNIKAPIIPAAILTEKEFCKYIKKWRYK